MLSPGEVDYLIEATRSSVKRFGGAGPTLSHLAFVLSDKWPEPFTAVFGADGPDGVRRLLQRKSFVGDEAEVRALLGGHDTKDAALAALLSRLSGVLEEPVPDAASSAAAAASDGTEDSSRDEEPATAEAWPERTRRMVVAVEPRTDLLERDEAVDHVVSVLRRKRRRIPIILGRRGSGRTTMLGGVAGKLAEGSEPMRVWRIGPETMGYEPHDALTRLIDDCETDTVIVVDDFDRLAALGTGDPNARLLLRLRAAADHPRLRLILVCEHRYYRRLGMLVEDFVERLVPVSIDGLSDEAVRKVVDAAVPEVEAAHGVTVTAALRSLAVVPARTSDPATHPGLALDRLDAAASHASVVGSREADVVHLAGLSAHSSSRAKRARDLEVELSQRVRGQGSAVRAVAARLALTLARLDLRPERPDGVFLFVGPTGVGKTELARAMSESLFGSEDRLIRLDMSEYSHDWAVSRLVGPMPGFVGSTEPEHWLTTKVAQMPDCVVLLDEIEKAHPTVWNTFLQVFDAGRLTDSRGTTADFSNVVMVMTSNIGAAQATAPGLGFGSAAADVDLARERITRAVKERMAPELINRIDELVVFDGLAVDAIEEIAARELLRVSERLAEQGWSVSYDGAVVKYLVTTGYDPAYGARHLQRNIERIFLGLIAQADRRAVTVRVGGDGLERIEH